jgi:hypothetical protein
MSPVPLAFHGSSSIAVVRTEAQSQHAHLLTTPEAAVAEFTAA